MRDVENSTSTADSLADSGDVESKDSKLASAISNVTPNTDLRRKINAREDQAEYQGRLLKGRRMLKIIYDWHRVVEAEGCIYDITHLESVKMHNQNLSNL